MRTILRKSGREKTLSSKAAVHNKEAKQRNNNREAKTISDITIPQVCAQCNPED